MYEDIINLPHHESKTHKHMDIISRAAQFAPFDPLDGYEEGIIETNRQTEDFIDMNEDFKNDINARLKILLENVKSHPKAKITYFVKDTLKEGGKYLITEEKIKRIDVVNKLIYFENGERIDIDMIMDIQGEIIDKTLQNL